MKSFWVALVLVFSASAPLAAEGLYFDIGIGVGQATTTIDGTNTSDYYDSLGYSLKETGLDLGLKLGYGPIAGYPLYIVGDIGGIAHRFEDDSDFVQYNSYVVGPGIVYYPVPFIQLAASVGYSWINNQSSDSTIFYDSESGYGGNISAAFDWGEGDNGLLLGLKFSYSKNTYEVVKVDQDTSLVSVFIRYAYRQKLTPQ